MIWYLEQQLIVLIEQLKEQLFGNPNPNTWLELGARLVVGVLQAISFILWRLEHFVSGIIWLTATWSKVSTNEWCFCTYWASSFTCCVESVSTSFFFTTLQCLRNKNKKRAKSYSSCGQCQTLTNSSLNFASSLFLRDLDKQVNWEKLKLSPKVITQ